MPKRKIKGATVVATNRSWKLLSMIQLIGMSDRSKLNTLKCPQNARNVDGSCTGYSVATFERIWVNVIKILYLVCTNSKKTSILPVLEWVFPGVLLPFPLFKRYNARLTARSPRHASPPYSDCREDPSHRMHNFCPLHTYRLSASS
jgi:hypothetical protein